jgi:hypothetical protein
MHSGLSRLNEEYDCQGDTLFSCLGRHNLDLVVDYCVVVAIMPVRLLMSVRVLVQLKALP